MRSSAVIPPASVVVLLILLIVPSTGLLPYAHAITPSIAVSFRNYLEAVPSAEGVVGIGTVSCSGGSPSSRTYVLFSVSASETGSTVTGSWGMILPGALVEDSADITGGSITSTSFSLTGTWTSPPKLICSSATVPATFTISGNCGTSVTVTFTASNGVTATFPGDVNCRNTFQLLVQTQDQTGTQIYGYYTILYDDSSSIFFQAVSTSYSPATFILNSGQTYTVQVSDFGSCHFDHWLDTGGTTSSRDVAISSDTTLTAAYVCGGSSASVTVDSLNQNGHAIFEYYTVLYDSGASMLGAGFTPKTFQTTSGDTYSVQADDFGACSFARWSDSVTSNPRTFTATSGGLEFTAEYHCTPVSFSKTINLSTVSSSGTLITGYYTTLWQSGVQIASCFSPCSFTVDNAKTYQIAVADFGGESFSHWNDALPPVSTIRFHDINPGFSTTVSLTAIYSP